MPISKTKPMYNLSFIVRETGIKPDTLRAWERRYGLPKPTRSPSGHRLYSQGDVEIVYWLLARQAEGMRIGQAVALWKTLEAQAQAPSERQVALSWAAEPFPPHVSNLDTLRHGWVNACLAFNEAEAEQALNQAFSLFPIEEVCIQVLQRGLQEIGDLWYQNRATVQQEHFASMLTERRIQTLIAAAPSPIYSERILLACPPGELHTISLSMLALFLRRRGWSVYNLGADVPLEHMTDALEQINPHLVVLSAQELYTAATLDEMARAIYTTSTPVAFGGRAFNLYPVLQTRVAGVFLGTSLTEAVHTIETWFSSPRSQPGIPPRDPDYQEILQAFLRQRPFIEEAVLSALPEDLLSTRMVQSANNYLARDLIAALTFGDLSLLDTEMKWVLGLLSHSTSDGLRLQYYLKAYASAVQDHMGERGSQISAWLAQMITSVTSLGEGT
jgi:methanogenic corrinoid protein MtbC1